MSSIFDATGFSLRELPYFHQWEAVFYVQLIWFALLVVGSLLLILINFSHLFLAGLKGFAIYFSLFCALKTAGGICSVIFLHGSTMSEGVFIASYIFNSVSLGVLTKSMFPFLEKMMKGDPTLDEKVEQRPLLHFNGSPITPLRILTLLLTVAIITSIVGATGISSTPVSSTTTTMFKVSAVLFTVGVLAMAACLVYVGYKYSYYSKICWILFISVPLLIVRCSYSLASAFHGINFSSPSQFMIIFGDYKYYAFMSLLTEGIIGVIYLGTFFWFITSHKSLSRGSSL
ncbi:uncharacterized protein RJT20DRAFT_60620 [Scheffersomyces xylosifermentans]|uniref:uncharacterized protein n=1 Tax=Scheffersomyces xylosifermentans TaxID=1304137 RepID=UPI00315C5B7C